jgi:hypothetical protein
MPILNPAVHNKMYRIPSPGSRTKLWVSIAAIALVSIACSISIGGPKTIPAPRIPASDFILDTRAFPPDWILFPCEPHCKPGVISTVRSFGIIDIPGHVIQEVLYLGDEKTAHDEFQSYRKAYFGKSENRSPSTEFLPPSEIAYSSSIADEYYLGCGVDVVPACKAILRYDSYLVYLYFSLERGFAGGVEIGADGLTLEQVETILRAMDERAAMMLGTEAAPSRPWQDDIGRKAGLVRPAAWSASWACQAAAHTPALCLKLSLPS